MKNCHLTQQNDYDDANESESDYSQEDHESDEKEALHKIDDDKLPYLGWGRKFEFSVFFFEILFE